MLGALACAYAVGAARRSRAHRGLTRAEQVSFYGGWAVTAMALISPLCALSVSLFSARVSQHMVLALVGAPLVAAGRPWNAFGALCKPGEAAAAAPAATPASSACFAACGLFAALLWCWHAPAPYAATFASNAAYWSMHVSVYGAALWLWHALLDPRPARIVPRHCRRPADLRANGPPRRPANARPRVRSTRRTR
ncbi:MAG: cytochrome c oxidase assembly protein [Rhodospirillales bacterium]